MGLTSETKPMDAWDNFAGLWTLAEPREVVLSRGPLWTGPPIVRSSPRAAARGDDLDSGMRTDSIILQYHDC